MNYVIGIISSCGKKKIKFKNKRKIPKKDKWEYCDFIILIPLLGLYHRQPLLHMSKIFVYINTTYERINPFSIGYMINPTLQVNKVFRDKVEKFLRDTFHQNTMKGIKHFLRKIIPVLLHW